MHFDATSPALGNVLQSYGPAGFTVNGTLHEGPILLTLDSVTPFTGDITEATLAPLLAMQPPLEFLILGYGPHLQIVPPALRATLRARGIAVDGMDTGAACRTYSVMQSEGRRVGAALLLPA